MKVVINRCFGGFGLSHEAIMKYAALAMIDMIAIEKDKNSTMLPYEYYVGEVADDKYWSEYDLERDDPNLVKVVEQMGNAANGFAAELTVVEIPDDVKWHLCEYDGIEHIAEEHRTWR